MIMLAPQVALKFRRVPGAARQQDHGKTSQLSDMSGLPTNFLRYQGGAVSTLG